METAILLQFRVAVEIRPTVIFQSPSDLNLQYFCAGVDHMILSVLLRRTLFEPEFWRNQMYGKVFLLFYAWSCQSVEGDIPQSFITSFNRR